MILQLGAKLDLFAFKNHVGCADSAHLAAHGAGVAVGRRSALKVRTSLFRVNRVFEHLIPVNLSREERPLRCPQREPRYGWR